jgi:queuosine precursor transporter
MTKKESQMIKNIKKAPQLKYYNLLSMAYVTFLLAAVVVVYKVVAIGSFTISEGTIIFPMTYFLGDVIAEIYGYRLSRRLIWYALICEIMFTSVITLIIKIPGPVFWHHQAAYELVLGRILHVSFANALAIPVGAFVNAYAITKWKISFKGRFFWLRSLISTAIGELVFCLIAPTVVFIGVLPLERILDIIFSTYLVKMIFAVISVYPAVLGVRLLKKHEKIDIYDYNTNFSPFRLTIDD